jgi:hypothetical protein
MESQIIQENLPGVSNGVADRLSSDRAGLETGSAGQPCGYAIMVWEQRWHPLRREWVILSAHRNDRPWHGEVVPVPRSATTAYDPECYLCPGNRRVSGRTNEPYTGIFVFDNDLPCVSADAPRDLEEAPGIYRSRPAGGHIG